MKSGRAHRVPLAQPALYVLINLTTSGEPDTLVFPGMRGSLSDMSLSAVLRRTGVDATVHGFRSTWTGRRGCRSVPTSLRLRCLSAGGIAFELEGAAAGLEALLSRLIDASAIPRVRGHGTRARLGDVAVSVLRLAEDHVWLLADRSHDRYLALWLARAMDAVASDVQ